MDVDIVSIVRASAEDTELLNKSMEFVRCFALNNNQKQLWMQCKEQRSEGKGNEALVLLD